MPLQVEFGLQSTALLDLQISHDLAAHPICQDLVQRFEASNFSICYTRSGNSDLKVLTFDAPASYKQQVPIRTHISSIMFKLLIEEVSLKFISLQDYRFTMSQTGNIGRKF